MDRRWFPGSKYWNSESDQKALDTLGKAKEKAEEDLKKAPREKERVESVKSIKEHSDKLDSDL